MESKTSQELLSMSAGELLLWCQDLQVDRDELESQLAAAQSKCDKMEGRAELAEAKLRERKSRADQDRADAERYKFLRRAGGKHGKSAGYKILRDELHASMEFAYWIAPEELDAAIDAAMKDRK